ncbi:MAG TPA: beta-ribofuranosylaminobenzene 5'-phosphate synthase family protein [Gemmatimonadales bacterium]|nr:beta-ribofuranosylaminobenzene 5'-phosphate synthase family protein [Gemmatimonadales bacterium]
MSRGDSVFVRAPARLHFGVLDLRGSLGRRFGGLGAAIPSPSLLLEVSRSRDGIAAEGPDADRAAEFARRFLAHHGLSEGARVVVHRPIPAHSGLGSGTQLGLSVARALAELHGLPAGPTELARAVARGRRSAIGTWAFALGGFIVEGGRRPGDHGVAPLIGRYEIPERWRCVVAVPPGSPGLSGEAEAAAFEQLPPPPGGEAERVSHLVLMQLLPALVEGDLPSFGEALSGIQRLTGAWFAPQQGGVFAPGPGEALIRALGRWGAAGVGQSSWGPAVYGLVEGAGAGATLAERCRDFLGEHGLVFEGGFAPGGARLARGAPPSAND